MISPLASSIASALPSVYEQPDPLPWQSFLEQQQQEGEGGAGGGDAGGGAAVADAPPDGGGGGDPGGDADLLSFSAPDAGAIADSIIRNKPEPKPKPTAPTKGTAAPAKPGAKPGEEPVAQLRSNYEATKKELEELKATHAKGDPRITAAQAERDAAKAELDAAKIRVSEYEQRLALSNPEVTKELRTLDEQWQRDAEKFYTAVPEIDHGGAMALVKDYAGLPFGRPEYKAAREEFENKVNAALGGDEGLSHRKLDKTLDWIQRAYEFGKERPTVERRVQENARKISSEYETKTYGEKKTRISGLVQKALTVPDDLAKTDPLHPKVVLKNFDETLTPEQVASIDANIPQFAELVMAGMAPDDDAKYAGMNAQQIAESKGRQSQRYEAARDHAVDVLVNGMRALRRMPILMQMLAKYKEKAGHLIDGDPPDPGTAGEGGDDDLSKIEFPTIPADLR